MGTITFPLQLQKHGTFGGLHSSRLSCRLPDSICVQALGAIGTSIKLSSEARQLHQGSCAPGQCVLGLLKVAVASIGNLSLKDATAELQVHSMVPFTEFTELLLLLRASGCKVLHAAPQLACW